MGGGGGLGGRRGRDASRAFRPIWHAVVGEGLDAFVFRLFFAPPWGRCRFKEIGIAATCQLQKATGKKVRDSEDELDSAARVLLDVLAQFASLTQAPLWS